MATKDMEILRVLPSLKDKQLSSDYLESLDEYYHSLCFLSQNKFSLEFNNKDENHGAIVMSLLFKNAEDKIRIFAGDFGGKICDNDFYINSLKDAIDRGIKVEVVFEENPNQSSRCFSLLKEKSQKNSSKITMKQLNENYKRELFSKFNGSLLHFTVVDNNKFRYETDKKTYKAYCNFDDKNNSEILISNFEKLEKNSLSIV